MRPLSFRQRLTVFNSRSLGYCQPTDRGGRSVPMHSCASSLTGLDVDLFTVSKILDLVLPKGAIKKAAKL